VIRSEIIIGQFWQAVYISDAPGQRPSLAFSATGISKPAGVQDVAGINALSAIALMLFWNTIASDYSLASLSKGILCFSNSCHLLFLALITMLSLSISMVKNM